MGKMTDARKEVIEILTNLPDSTTRDVSTLMPHVPFGTTASVLHLLKLEGIVEESGHNEITTADGKKRKQTTYRISANPTPVPVEPKVKRKQQGPTNAGYEARITELKAQIAELEQWKADAISRFPDLAVSPMVVIARKLVADEVRKSGDNRLADEIIAGRNDNTMLMRVTLKALEEA